MLTIAVMFWLALLLLSLALALSAVYRYLDWKAKSRVCWDDLRVRQILVSENRAAEWCTKEEIEAL